MPGISNEELDGHDWWFRVHFDADPASADGEVVLALGGIATVADVHLNGERIVAGESMFISQLTEVGNLLRASNELAICCRALEPLLRVSRRPRARWRTRLVSDGNVRFFRTMLLGRAPGFAPGPAVVGPWRPVRLERRHDVVVESLELRPRLDGQHGTLVVRARLRAPTGAPAQAGAAVELSGHGSEHHADLRASPPKSLSRRASDRHRRNRGSVVRTRLSLLKVRTYDNSVYILLFDEIRDQWELIMFSTAGAPSGWQSEQHDLARSAQSRQ